MRSPKVLLLLLLAALGAHAGDEPVEARADSVAYAFDTDAELERVGLRATGEAARRMPKPKRLGDKLYLLESWWRSTGSAGFPAPFETPAARIETRFTLVMNTGTEGLGFLWLPVGVYGDAGGAPEVETWEAPSYAGAVGVGFDASNPPNRDPFRGSGNAYDRPQHEVSLHFDGMEIAKATSPIDFRDEEEHALRIRLEFVVGGCDVSVWIDDVVVHDRVFLAHALPYVGRPAVGARNAETAGDVLIDDLVLEASGEAPASEEPLVVAALDRVLNDKASPRHGAEVAFPEDTARYGRIVATLRLDQPETRFDPWDRLAHVWILDGEDDRYELFRYITPYHRGHVWHVDVTRWRPLLRGTRTIEQACSTQGEGWVVSLSFAFYPGPSDRQATRVVKLWNGKAILGNPENPVEAFFAPREIALEEEADFAEVLLCVTGHGMAPNSENAAEFMPIERTLTVNGETHENLLWKDDCYLNPCRPQGGTWKYDRAGWCPGDVVRPWVVDVSPHLDEETLSIDYDLAPYVNENRGKTWEPFHRIESYVFLYRASPPR